MTEGAHVVLLDLEELDEAELDRLQGDYAKLARRTRELLKKGHPDTNVPELHASLRTDD